MAGEVVAELLANLAVEAGGDALIQLGVGERKRAVVWRVVTSMLVFLLFGFPLWGALWTFMDTRDWVGALLALLAAPFCMLAAWTGAREIWRLWHWGEPMMVIASEKIVIPRRNTTIRLADLSHIAVGRNGIRLFIKDRPGAIRVATRRGVELAALIEAYRKTGN
ncbi:hypothetical protein [Sandaracinobacteroides hominis]|uniref:hypothetical protein n=1 Tax=Sandaracinobacteroides hominis TaxID=2780086 RepID=UPI0018F647EF|nr:hypothetical protein [Sandaracinobacteroides hominis]